MVIFIITLYTAISDARTDAFLLFKTETSAGTPWWSRIRVYSSERRSTKQWGIGAAIWMSWHTIAYFLPHLVKSIWRSGTRLVITDIVHHAYFVIHTSWQYMQGQVTSVNERKEFKLWWRDEIQMPPLLCWLWERTDYYSVCIYSVSFSLPLCSIACYPCPDVLVCPEAFIQRGHYFIKRFPIISLPAPTSVWLI